MSYRPSKDCLRLASLVEQMRDAQNAYFQKRIASNLARSKEAERRVDEALAAIRKAESK